MLVEALPLNYSNSTCHFEESGNLDEGNIQLKFASVKLWIKVSDNIAYHR